MKSASANNGQPAAPRRPSHLRLVKPPGSATDTGQAVRLRPAGTPLPDGWQSVTVAAEPDENGVHLPSWEVQFDTAVIAFLVRGEPMYAEVGQDMVDSDWEEVLRDRPDGAPRHGTFWVQRLDAPSLVEIRERSRLMHPSNALDTEIGF